MYGLSPSEQYKKPMTISDCESVSVKQWQEEIFAKICSGEINLADTAQIETNICKLNLQKPSKTITIDSLGGKGGG